MTGLLIDKILGLLKEAGARLPPAGMICVDDITLNALDCDLGRKIRAHRGEVEEEIRLIRVSTLLIHQLYTARTASNEETRAAAIGEIAPLARVKASLLQDKCALDESDSDSDRTSVSSRSTRDDAQASEYFYRPPLMPPPVHPPPADVTFNSEVDSCGYSYPVVQEAQSDPLGCEGPHGEPELPSYRSIVPFGNFGFPPDNKPERSYAENINRSRLDLDIEELQRRYHAYLAKERRKLPLLGHANDDLLRRKAQLMARAESPFYLAELCGRLDFCTSNVDTEPSPMTIEGLAAQDLAIDASLSEMPEPVHIANEALRYLRKYLTTILVSREGNDWNIQPAVYSSADIDAKMKQCEQSKTTSVDHAWQVWLGLPMIGRSKTLIWLQNHVVEGTRSELVHAEQTSKGATSLGRIMQKLRLKAKTPGEAYLLVYRAVMLEEHVVAPIKLIDCVGRTFTFPWESANTSKKVEKLIKDAFRCHDKLGDSFHSAINDRCYDLFNEAGEIMLPSTWGYSIRPGMLITQSLWPQATYWGNKDDVGMHPLPLPCLEFTPTFDSNSARNRFQCQTKRHLRSGSPVGSLCLPPPPPLAPPPLPPMPLPVSPLPHLSTPPPPMATDIFGLPLPPLPDTAGMMFAPPPPPFSPPPASPSFYKSSPPPEVSHAFEPPPVFPPPVCKDDRSVPSSPSDNDSEFDSISARNLDILCSESTDTDFDDMSDDEILRCLQLKYLVDEHDAHTSNDDEELEGDA